jgi:hypothetical protein
MPVLHLNGCWKKLCPEGAFMLAQRISGERYSDVDDNDIEDIFDCLIDKLSEGPE